jgi:hypothetical protein
LIKRTHIRFSDLTHYSPGSRRCAERRSSPEREAILAALNGALGDYQALATHAISKSSVMLRFARTASERVKPCSFAEPKIET